MRTPVEAVVDVEVEELGPRTLVMLPLLPPPPTVGAPIVVVVAVAVVVGPGNPNVY